MKPRPSALIASMLAAIVGLACLAPASLPSSQAARGNSADADETAETGLLPVAPQDLFAALPGKMQLWTLVRSTAERRYGTWLESRVVREFERQLPPEKGKPPGPPARARLSITDTGRHPDAIAPFANFVADEDKVVADEDKDKDEDEDDSEQAAGEEADDESAGFERKFIDGHPAFLISDGEREHDIEMLVGGRFVVHLIIENQPEKFVKEWLRRIELGELTSIPDTATVELPEEIIISRIDQLNPRRNQAYQLATSSGKRVSQELAEDEVWLEETLGDIPELDEAPDGDEDSPVR